MCSGNIELHSNCIVSGEIRAETVLNVSDSYIMLIEVLGVLLLMTS